MSQGFQLKYHELISGVPIFFLPVTVDGEACSLKEAKELRAYSYTAGVRAEQMHPCATTQWDQYAFCVFKGQQAPAIVALGETAELMQRKQSGFFSRLPSHDCGRVQA